MYLYAASRGVRPLVRTHSSRCVGRHVRLFARQTCRQAGRRCRFFSASFVFRSEGRYLWAEGRDTSAVGIEVIVSHGRTDAMKPRPSSFSHHLLFFLLRPPAFSFLPLLLFLAPYPSTSICFIAYFQPDREEGRKRGKRATEGKGPSVSALSVCLSVQFSLSLSLSLSLSDVAWVAAAVPPTFSPLLQSSPGWFTRRFRARCHCDGLVCHV